MTRAWNGQFKIIFSQYITYISVIYMYYLNNSYRLTVITLRYSYVLLTFEASDRFSSNFV